MRILLLSWNFPPTLGGIEYVVENLFRGLRRQDQEVEVVAGHAEDDVPPEEGVYRASRRGLAAYLWHALWQGMACCRRNRPDVLVCGTVVPAPAAWVLSFLYRRPYVVLVHGSELLQTGWVYQRAIRFLYARARRLTANSSRTGNLLAQIGMDPDRIDVVHPGVKVEAFEGAGGESPADVMKMAEGRRVLLSVGRLVKRKGQLEFVDRVMPRLVERFPDLLLLIVGEDATASLVHAERMKEQIAAKVEERGLEGHVQLLGRLPAEQDVVNLMHRADVFVLPCLDLPGDVEGFGIVFLEAALGGTPTVATRVGGIPEAVVDGETGLLVEPGDDEGMVDVLTRLLEESDLRDRLGDAAAARARKDFSWDSICSHYMDTFRKCLPSHTHAT